MRIPWLSAIFAVVLILACDGYIFCDIWQSAGRKHRKAWCIVYAVFTLLCWALIAAMLAFPIKDPDVSLVPEMWMLLTALSIYIPKVVYCICSLIGRIFVRRKSDGGRGRNYGSYIGATVALLICVSIWTGVLYTRNQIVTNNIEIASSKLPDSFDGKRVLQFSDAHLGTWGNDTAFISRVVDSINAQKPDLILFTGDIVSRRSNELDPFVKVLSRIKAPLGVFAVHGNHDYASYVVWDDPKAANRDVARLDSLMTSMGWKVLNNAADFVKIGNDSIAIIGVENWGEPPFNQVGNLALSYPGGKTDKCRNALNDEKFKILMTHNPMHWSEVVRKSSNIDLTLSGHTHAMQFMIGSGKHKWSPSAYRYKNWAGLYTDTAKDGNPMNLYVNIGIGEVGYPTRVGSAKPELTVFTLKKSH